MNEIKVKDYISQCAKVLRSTETEMEQKQAINNLLIVASWSQDALVAAQVVEVLTAYSVLAHSPEVAHPVLELQNTVAPWMVGIMQSYPDNDWSKEIATYILARIKRLNSTVFNNQSNESTQRIAVDEMKWLYGFACDFRLASDSTVWLAIYKCMTDYICSFNKPEVVHPKKNVQKVAFEIMVAWYEKNQTDILKQQCKECMIAWWRRMIMAFPKINSSNYDQFSAAKAILDSWEKRLGFETDGKTSSAQILNG